MRKLVLMIAAALLMTTSLSGCYTWNHTVGTGAAGSNSVEKKQWYILFGLVPLNEVNSKTMADGAANYNVKTQASFVDVIISFVTSFVTIYPQTVTVTK